MLTRTTCHAFLNCVVEIYNFDCDHGQKDMAPNIVLQDQFISRSAMIGRKKKGVE